LGVLGPSAGGHESLCTVMAAEVRASGSSAEAPAAFINSLRVIFIVILLSRTAARWKGIAARLLCQDSALNWSRHGLFAEHLQEAE
jgi:hypothetical protein